MKRAGSTLATWKPAWVLPMNKVQLSPEAQDDLTDIRDYIEQELQNPDAALRTVGEITRRLRLLQEQAELGARMSAATGMTTDERFLVCGNYLAFYHILPGIVRVDRILYNKRDYQRILFNKNEQ